MPIEPTEPLTEWPKRYVLRCYRRRLPLGTVHSMVPEDEWERDYAPRWTKDELNNEDAVFWLQVKEFASEEERDSFQLSISTGRARIMPTGIDAESVEALQRRERYSNRGQTGKIRTTKGEVRLNVTPPRAQPA